MPQREIQLETAAFLDSAESKALGEVARDTQKHIVDRFLACAYDQLGEAPRHLDGQGMHQIVGHLLPGHFGRKDPLAVHAIEVLRAYLAFLETHAVVSQAFELKQALEHTAHEFESTVATGEHAHHAPHRPEKPFVHQASKTGRNDPCPCGSGKKFKQCCARL